MPKEIPPYRVKTSIFPNGERFAAVVDANGILSWDATTYGVMVLRESVEATGTMYVQCAAIVLLYNWAAKEGIDLKARTESLELLSSEEITSLRDVLRYDKRSGRGKIPKNKLVSPDHMKNRASAIREYIAWCARRAIHRMRVDDPKTIEARYRLEDFLRDITSFLPVSTSRTPPEGLDEEGQRLFNEVITPGDPRNPFQPQHQHRNEVLLRLYDETGARRSEPLKLKGEDLFLHGPKPHVHIARRPDDPDEKRIDEPNAKTHARDLSISVELAVKLDHWITNIRSDPARYGRAKRCPYVFVNRSGTALAKRTVGDMFELLRNRVPDMPPAFHAHLLRHTANDRFSEGADELGLSEEEERKARNLRMGWSKNSKQGDAYTQRHTRKAAERIIDIIQKKGVKGGGHG